MALWQSVASTTPTFSWGYLHLVNVAVIPQSEFLGLEILAIHPLSGRTCVHTQAREMIVARPIPQAAMQSLRVNGMLEFLGA